MYDINDPFSREEHDKLDGGMVELTLDRRVNKTGDIWHIFIEVIFYFRFFQSHLGCDKFAQKRLYVIRILASFTLSIFNLQLHLYCQCQNFC